jgi:hypothetical protein
MPLSYLLINDLFTIVDQHIHYCRLPFSAVGRLESHRTVSPRCNPYSERYLFQRRALLIMHREHNDTYS